MSAHTPGPWHAVKNSLNHGIYDADGNNVAGVKGSSIALHDRRHAADAALIAAAPDLLAALRAVDAHYSGSLDHQPAYVRLARAAIAKATGSDA
jgi:hypothetical protein